MMPSRLAEARVGRRSPTIRGGLLAVALATLWGCAPDISAQESPPSVPSEACTQGAVPPDADNFAEGQQQIVVRSAEAPYDACPPAIPFPCEMAVLEGNPRDEGLFTIRLRTTEPWVLPPHSHPRAERVTVLSGEIGVGFGASVDRTRGLLFTAADYYVNAPGAVHYVWADGPVEIQITALGPWEVHPHE